MKKTICVNGCAYEVQAETLIDLFTELGVEVAKKAIEINGCIIEYEAYPTTAIHAQDQIEIIQFVGGG